MQTGVVPFFSAMSSHKYQILEKLLEILCLKNSLP